MAPGLKVGDQVKAKAVNVLGNRRAGDVFGPWAAKSELHGSVIECVGVGRTRKLKVKWNECDDISILSARSLEIDDLCASVEAVEESTDSESSIDEEAGDSMDYSEGWQSDLEEPGVSQLRPHGTEWAVETEGIQIDYYDGARRHLDFIWTFDNPVEQRSPLEYFCAMFPMVEATFWIEKTNTRLAEMKRKPLSKCEYFQTWWHRLAATFFGITVIDAMLAYNYERRVDAKSVEDFTNDLALSLVFNKFDGYELVSRRRLSDEPIAAEPPIPVVPFEAHLLKSLLTLPLYKENIGSKEGARRKCYVCAAQGKRHNAHYFCVTCSDVSQGSIVVICGHNSLRGTSCHAYHCQNAK